MSETDGDPLRGAPPPDPFPAATDLGQIRVVADYLPQLAWSCLPDGHCDYLSRRWVEYTGVPEAEHHGRGWLGAVHPDDRARTRAVWEGFVAGTADYDAEYRLRRHDGAYLWFKARGALVRGPRGEPVRVFGTSTDIDAQKQAEARYRENRERLEAALAASGTGTFRWDIATDALDWDEQLDRLFGLPPGQTVRSLGKFVERVHPDDRPGVIERCRRCRDEGADFAMEFRVVWPDGSTRWLDDRGRTFRDAAGRPAYMTGACVDITDRKQAEERLRELDERAALVRRASGVGFWYCDLPFGVLEWDDLVKEHFHLPPDARVTIDTFYDRIHPDDREATRAAIERSIAARGGYDVHYRTVHPETGAQKWVRAIGRTTYAADGAPRRFDGVTLDVTDRVQAQEQLRASEERFRAFMDHSPAAAWITDADGRVRYVSAAYTRLFRLPGRDIVGAAPADLYPEEFAREYVRNIRAVAESGGPLEAVERAPRPDGTVGEFLVYKFPLPGADLVGGVAVDITERLRAEEQLREADRRKDEFLALLAHELRNPLAPLRNGLQVLRLTGPAAPAAAQALAIMERQLGHMVRLIDDLLDVSRITRNKLELRTGRVDLAAAVQYAVETSRPVIEERGHELTVALPPGPLPLDADLTRLAQVFANLLNNSARYTPPGGRIRLDAERCGGEVVVRVRDDGIGIPAEALSRIFDMFSQVDRRLERSTGGLGIGLSLVKGLVEMHGGSVAAASDGEGRGSTFTVRLPAPDGGAGREPAAGAAPRAAAPGRRVLVVDDNADAAASLAALLRLTGHEVRTARDGLEAVQAAAAYRPDLILMDLGMPRLNGFDAACRIREQPWGRRAVIVALTGWGQDEDRRRSHAAGFDGHLVKPVEPEALDRLLAGLTAGPA